MNRLTALLFCLSALAVSHAQVTSYGLSVEVVAEHDSGVLSGMTTYHLYMECVNTDDVVSSVSGDATFPLDLNTTTSFFQDALGAATPNAVNPLLFGFFPDLEYDSWVTIGISQQPDGAANEGEVSVVESPTQAWLLPFETGGNIVIDDPTGGAWFVTQNYSNGIAGDDHKVLLAQLTTDGEISGTLLVQIFEHGVGESDLRFHLSFDGTNGSGAGGCIDPEADNFNPTAAVDDGSCLYGGCIDDAACNYDPTANDDDGSCTYAAPFRDCDGNCLTDTDGDGTCDEEEIAGCTDATAWNYDPAATDEDGGCVYFNACGIEADAVV